MSGMNVKIDESAESDANDEGEPIEEEEDDGSDESDDGSDESDRESDEESDESNGLDEDFIQSDTACGSMQSLVRQTEAATGIPAPNGSKGRYKKGWLSYVVQHTAAPQIDREFIALDRSNREHSENAPRKDQETDEVDDKESILKIPELSAMQQCFEENNKKVLLGAIKQLDSEELQEFANTLGNNSELKDAVAETLANKFLQPVRAHIAEQRRQAPGDRRTKLPHLASLVSKEHYHFKCRQCYRRFVDKSRLTLHIRREHLPKELKCEYCSKLYVNRFELTAHVNALHLKTVEYKCASCGKKFFRPASLRQHLIGKHKLNGTDAAESLKSSKIQKE